MENENAVWTEVNFHQANYDMAPIVAPFDYAVFKKYVGPSHLRIFLVFLDQVLLFNIWYSYSKSHWLFGERPRQGCPNEGKFVPSDVYAYFTVYIRIVGLQNAPKKMRLVGDRYAIPLKRHWLILF